MQSWHYKHYRLKKAPYWNSTSGFDFDVIFCSVWFLSANQISSNSGHVEDVITTESSVCDSDSSECMCPLAISLHVKVTILKTRISLWHSYRSASSAALIVRPTFRSSIGDRSFPVAAARTWNSLPPSVTASQSLQTFRKRLKTELFQRSYTTASLPWLSIL